MKYALVALKNTISYLVFFVVLTIFLAAMSAEAQQNVTIDTDRNASVFGNSVAPDYTCQPGLACLPSPPSPDGNTLTINSSIINGLASSAFGGFGFSANNNTVITNAATVGASVHAGWATGNSAIVTANGNSAHIDNNSTITSSVYGASVNVSGSGLTIIANDNIVNITDSTVRTHIQGADVIVFGSGDVSANSNTVNINSGTVNSWYGYIKGGSSITQSGDANVNFNHVNINGGTIGGATSLGIDGGLARTDNGTATAEGNEVVISAGTISGNSGSGRIIRGGASYGSQPGTTAVTKNNKVYISGGTVNMHVYGGENQHDNSGVESIASDNIVSITGGSITGDVYGGSGYNAAAGGKSAAVNNTVNISGGMVTGNVYGGEGFNNLANNDSRASGNVVNISGGAVTGDVYGGIAVNTNASPGALSAVGNTVNISGNPALSGSGVYGGLVDGVGGGDAFTGNTLNLKTSGLTLDSLGNFEYLNFYLPASLGDGGTVVTAASAVDIGGSIVNVGVDGASSPLREGDTVNLIDASAGALTGTPSNTTSDGAGMLGVTLRYEFDILVDGDMLLATVTKAAVNEQTKSLSEGRLAGATFVNQGSDFLAEVGVRSAVDAAHGERHASGGGLGMSVFSSVRAGDVRHNTGSHIDLRGLSLLVGLARTAGIVSNDLTVGVFFEYGKASYDTYNSFADLASVRANGDTNYRGGGILARMDFADNGTRSLYGELSFRMGRTYNSYQSQDLRDSAGRTAAYDFSSRYHGFHIGAGYVRDVTESASVELYGRYLWTRVGDGSVRISTGEEISFNRVDSSRIKLGAKVSHEFNPHLAAYAGASIEHEFEGRAGAMTNGFFIPEPNLNGATGIGELGVSLSPSAGSGLSVDLGVQGYVGKRQGVTGSLSVKFSF
jgi:hypothetical protein